MAEATDATVVVTAYLRSLYPLALQARIYVVHDGIERPLIGKSDWGSERGRANVPLKAVLVTSASIERLPSFCYPPPWLKVRIVGRYADGLRRWRQIRWAWNALPSGERLSYLRFLVDRRIERVPWDVDGVYGEMMQADIGVIPIEASPMEPGSALPPTWKVKSENRLTMKMSMGLPVVAVPIPSYESVIEHGVNGFFARSKSDWEKCLSALRDPARRREMGLSARASVATRYSMKEQAVKLIRVLRAVCADLPPEGSARIPQSTRSAHGD